MYSANLVITLNAIANEYRDRIFREITAVLSQAKYLNTGAGLESLKVVVIPGTETKSPDIIITMDDHMNILNKRRMQWTKMPRMDMLEEWAKTKTFEGPIPGYKNGLAPNLPPWKAKSRILWAMAKSKQKFDTWKAKPWRKKALSNVLKELNAKILLEFDRAIEADFQLSINNGLNG